MASVALDGFSPQSGDWPMWFRWYVWMALAVVFSLTSWWIMRRRSRSRLANVWRWGAMTVCGIGSVAGLLVGGYLLWWFHGRLTSREEQLFGGIRYIRTIGEAPRLSVAHILLVDLGATNLSFAVTRPDSNSSSRLKAETVQDFLETSGVQIAINANFFEPFHSNSPWDYYPRRGDAVEVLGIAASEGQQYGTQVWRGATLYLSRENKAEMGGKVEGLWNAISGDQWLVRDGQIVASADTFGAYPRAAAALNKSADTLILAVVDGKQPGYSEGVTLPELARLLENHGAHNAINLDGGGSVTLVCARLGGKPVVLNSPIHTRIPGRQRPVANHLGITANPPAAR